MKISDIIVCPDFPCPDVDRNACAVPPAEVDPLKIKAVIIAEAPPNTKADYYYAPGLPAYLQTTLAAFRDAGTAAGSMQDILDLGFYVTTAVKCGKTGYAVSPAALKNCAALLEKELALFPNLRAVLLGGDAAIKMMNAVWKKQTGRKVVPAGSTYKIRAGEHRAGNIRAFLSYTPAGKNFLIEKSKRQMVAEDIRAILDLVK